MTVNEEPQRRKPGPWGVLLATFVLSLFVLLLLWTLADIPRTVETDKAVSGDIFFLPLIFFPTALLADLVALGLSALALERSRTGVERWLGRAALVLSLLLLLWSAVIVAQLVPYYTQPPGYRAR